MSIGLLMANGAAQDRSTCCVTRHADRVQCCLAEVGVPFFGSCLRVSYKQVTKNVLKRDEVSFGIGAPDANSGTVSRRPSQDIKDWPAGPLIGTFGGMTNLPLVIQLRHADMAGQRPLFSARVAPCQHLIFLSGR